MDIEYPASAREQTAIATILSKVDEAIDATEQSIKAAEKLKRALMQNLLTGKLKPDGTWRKEDEFYEDEKFGKVPKGWEWKQIKSITKNVQYGLNKSASDNGIYPMFRMNNIIDGKMIDDPMVYVNLPIVEYEKYRLQKGDILFNRTNSMDLVGKVGIFDIEGDFVFASYLIRLQTDNNNNSYYLNYYLNSYSGQCSLRSKATPAVSQANINAKSLRNTYVPCPRLEEQQQIVDTINAVEDNKFNFRIKIQKLKKLKKALMQHLLTGKVRLSEELIVQLSNQEKEVVNG
jgi:type I restriction enzyme S subunit